MTQAYVYKWTHLPTMKWYVGSRTAKGCHPDDGYICSSKVIRPLIISKPWEWQREIVEVGDAIEMRELEAEILELFDAAKDPRSFNKNNANGRFSTTRLELPHSEQTKIKIGLAQKGRNLGLTYEEIHGPEKAKQLRDNLKSKPGPNLGRRWEDEIREKQKVAASKRPKVSNKTKQKMSLSQRGKRSKLSPEEVYEIKYILSYKECKEKYSSKVSIGTIEQIRGRKSWKYI